MKKILLCAFAALFIKTSAQTEVETYRPGLTNSGVTYFLPNTKLHISVTAQRTTYTPGEYWQYAPLYFRLNDAIQNEYSVWEITDISIEPYGAANKDKAYSIKFKPKTTAPLVGLAPDGRLLSVNTAAPEIPELSRPSVTVKRADPTNGADFKTQEILSAGSKAKMAELTAAEIYDIRENRSLLTKGQADFMPKDGEQLRLMLKSLDEQEQGLLSLFKGTTKEEIHTFTFDYTPDAETQADLLFRFSRHFGVMADDEKGGTPYYISVTDDRALPNEISPEKPKKPIEDLRYIVPGSACIKIFSPLSNVVEMHTPLAQFGHVEHLGGDLFNKMANTRLTLSPSTGGIVKIEAAQFK